MPAAISTIPLAKGFISFSSYEMIERLCKINWSSEAIKLNEVQTRKYPKTKIQVGTKLFPLSPLFLFTAEKTSIIGIAAGSIMAIIITDHIANAARKSLKIHSLLCIMDISSIKPIEFDKLKI